MSRGRKPALFGLLFFLASLLVAVNAPAGDDDERPAYMIYVDPETGRYTTEDPYADMHQPQALLSAPPVAPERAYAHSTSTWLRIAMTAAAAVALLAFAGRRHLLRRRNG